MYNLIILLPELQLNLIKLRLVEMTRTLFFHKFSATLKKRKEQIKIKQEERRPKQEKGVERRKIKENGK